jgi:hypothetical protein
LAGFMSGFDYLCWAGEDFYSEGSSFDFVGYFETAREAAEAVVGNNCWKKCEWVEILGPDHKWARGVIKNRRIEWQPDHQSPPRLGYALKCEANGNTYRGRILETRFPVMPAEVPTIAEEKEVVGTAAFVKWLAATCPKYGLDIPVGWISVGESDGE